MSITLKINHADRAIVMSRDFAKRAENTHSVEYDHLQRVRGDYPTYEVTIRSIKRNAQKETYKGLTYEYMHDYIASHEDTASAEAILAEFDELRLISQCHSQGKRYPTIKKWFLDKYPLVATFGTDDAA